MKKGLRIISANHTLDFYLDKNNIHNQELVSATISHFEIARNNIFKPVEFLNLLRKQFYFVLDNPDKPKETLEQLKSLPLSAEQKHILYFFIIWWFGGVGNMSHKRTLRLIENEFKMFKGTTPEKEQYFKDLPQFYQLTFNQIKKAKLNFDKLTYPEKLKFWDEHIIKDFSYTSSSIGFFLENDSEIEDDGITPDRCITIFPKNKVEIEQHNRWLLNLVQTNNVIKNNNTEILKSKYFATVKDNPRAIEFTEQEINTIIKRRDKERIYYEADKEIYYWGYYCGYLSVVKNNRPHLELGADKFKNIVDSYAKGIADAHYLSFLESQLEQQKMGKSPTSLEKGKENLPSVALQTIDKVLIADDYLQIIREMYELERITVGDYLEDRFTKLTLKNPHFIKCLYKYIYKVLDGVHKEGEPDLLIENGDFVIEYGDIKLTGKISNLDCALIWLRTQLVEGFRKIDPFKWQEQLRHFENDFLNINYDPPAVTEKIAILNNELKNGASDKNDLTAPVFALFLHYLLSSKEETGGKGLKNITILCQKYKYTKSPKRLKNIVNSVNKENETDPISINNLEKVRPSLLNYPNALKLANNELYSLKANE